MVVAIDFIDKGDARLSIAVGAGDDPVPNVRSVNHARRRRLFNQGVGKIRGLESFLIPKSNGGPVRPAVDNIVAAGDGIENRLVPGLAVEIELIPFVVIDRVEKLVRYVDRNIKVGQRVLVVLGVNETQNVRMRDAHHAHVGAPTHATLLHRVSGRVEDVHERHGTAGYAVGCADHRATRSQLFKSETGAAAGLMNDRCVSRRLHDPGDRVRHVQYKAGRQLAIGLAGIHQAGRVGNELAR